MNVTVKTNDYQLKHNTSGIILDMIDDVKLYDEYGITIGLKSGKLISVGVLGDIIFKHNRTQIITDIFKITVNNSDIEFYEINF